MDFEHLLPVRLWGPFPGRTLRCVWYLQTVDGSTKEMLPETAFKKVGHDHIKICDIFSTGLTTEFFSIWLCSSGWLTALLLSPRFFLFCVVTFLFINIIVFLFLIIIWLSVAMANYFDEISYLNISNGRSKMESSISAAAEEAPASSNHDLGLTSTLFFYFCPGWVYCWQERIEAFNGSCYLTHGHGLFRWHQSRRLSSNRCYKRWIFTHVKLCRHA